MVTKSGSFFSYGDERLGQGRNNAKAYLDEHVEVAKEIESKVYDALGIGQDLVTPIEREPGAVEARGRRGGRGRWRREPRHGRVGPPLVARRGRRPGRRAADGPGGAAGARAGRSPGARSTGATGPSSSCAASSPRSASRPRRREVVLERAARGRLRRRRELRAALRRRPPAARRLGLGADRAPAARARRRARAHRRGARRAGPRRTSWRRRSRCCAGACPSRPATPRERDRALGMLVRKGYELELAYDAAAPPRRARTSALLAQ